MNKNHILLTSHLFFRHVAKYTNIMPFEIAKLHNQYLTLVLALHWINNQDHQR